MPHVVLTGDVSIEKLEGAFHPLREEKDEWLIKIEELYVERGRRCALLPVVVVEEGHPQSFYIRLSQNEGKQRLTVRLDPSTDPIKTRGVKRSVALVAETFLALSASAKVVRHNLEGYLRKPSGPSSGPSADFGSGNQALEGNQRVPRAK